MSQVLTISYEDNHKRVINLRDEFFNREDNVAKKVRDIAYKYGHNPLTAVLYKADKVFYENTFKVVDKKPLKETKLEEKELKKSLRNEFKNKPLKRISFDQINDFS